MPERQWLVSGEIRFGEGDTAFSEAIAFVQLQDVTRVDAPARVVAQQVIPHVAYQPGRPGRLAFELHGPSPDECAQYIVSVHLDVDGDGEISRGDYITTQSYPVVTFGYPQQVTIQLQRI